MSAMPELWRLAATGRSPAHVDGSPGVRLLSSGTVSPGAECCRPVSSDSENSWHLQAWSVAPLSPTENATLFTLGFWGHFYPCCASMDRRKVAELCSGGPVSACKSTL